MSKQKGIARKGADKKTVALVEDVLAMAAKNRYSVSKIFAAHNAVFELKEQAQSCASCLTIRVSALRKWYGEPQQIDNPEAFRNAVLGDTTPAQTAGLTDEQVKTYIENAAKELGLSEDSTREEFLAALTQLEQGQHPAEVTTRLKEAIESLQAQDAVAGPAAWTEARTATMGINEGSTDAERLTALQSIGVDEFPSEDHAQFVANEITEYEARIAGPDYLDPTHPNHVAPAKGVTRYPMGEGLIPLDFTPSKDDALKGTIRGADGSNVKADTYTTADGTTIAVSVGNKATIKDDLI